MPRVLLLLALAAHLALSATAADPSCKNPSNKNVEWFIVYKLPKTKAYPESTYVPDGSEMAYVDSSMKDATKWTRLAATIYEAKGNPIALTMADLFKGSQPAGLYATYSDQPPEPYTGTAMGHTKGVIQFSKKTGYWLLHSVPRFPFNVTTKTYEYPESGRNNGQVLMCISLKGDQLKKVAVALRQQYPYIYESGAPDDMITDPEIEQLLAKKFVRKPAEPVLIDTLTGTEGTEFTTFAKHQSFDEEIYAASVANHYDASLIVETWRNGAGGKLDATCPAKGPTVTNMANVVVKFTDGKQSVFTTTEDHAKWAISADPKKPVFCKGSLNRMLSQYKRGGETMCMTNPTVHALFGSSVEKCETCAGKKAETNYCKIRL